MTANRPGDEPPAHHLDEPVEARDVEPRRLMQAGVVFVLLLVVAGAMALLTQTVFIGRLPNFSPQPPVLPAVRGVATPLAPPLQPNAVQDLQQMRAHEDEILGSYGWVDRRRGVTRIPIDRAMDLLLQRGLPVQPVGTAQPYQDEGAQLPGDASSGRMLERVRP
jgi:hypothetical protein